MRIRRFAVVAAIALLVVGAVGVRAVRSFAQGGASTSTAQEEVVGADTDTDDEQVGDQNAPDETDTAEEAVGVADTDNVEEQVGERDAPDTGEEAESADGQETAAAGTAAITADLAKANAEASLNAGTATTVELDDENGKLVYSVEIGSTDVKVDAMTGTVLGVESDQD